MPYRKNYGERASSHRIARDEAVCIDVPYREARVFRVFIFFAIPHFGQKAARLCIYFWNTLGGIDPYSFMFFFLFFWVIYTELAGGLYITGFIRLAQCACRPTGLASCESRDQARHVVSWLANVTVRMSLTEAKKKGERRSVGFYATPCLMR